MKFESGKMYRHRNFLDVDMYIINVEDVGSDYRMTVRWFNRFNMLLDPKVDHFNVCKEHIHNWKCLS